MLCGGVRAQSEKVARGSLKSAVERKIKKDEVLIADDLNYIKGFRYELYCIARALGTTCCTVHCDATPEQILKLNDKEKRYNPAILTDLPNRFERPNDRNRWERPLFVVRPEDERIPLEDLMAAIDGQNLAPNLATVTQPVVENNLLHEIDLVTTQILGAVQKAQTAGDGGERISIPGSSKTFVVTRVVPVGEQRRIKRQFMKVVTDDGQMPASAAHAADMFVDFFLRQIAAE
jgi:protein KTI12